MDGNTPSSPTPFTPPTTEEDRLSWLRLIRSRRVGPGTFWWLMAEHGSAAAALDALPAIARAAGIDDYTTRHTDEARRELAAARRAGAWPLFLGEADYPAALATINDAPPLLWARGHREVLARPIVAMVGARNASSLGGRMARKLAEGLGWHGFAIVSGLARGIDTSVHGAALQTGTLAVMASGVDVIYPAENAALAAAIADQGLLLSEQPIGMQPQARHFPRRNRIVSGLSLAVVVIEAAEGSGSLITAREALEQGREVLAVPGHPLDARSAGCNQLIRDGAHLVRDTTDIVTSLSEMSACARSPRSANMRAGAPLRTSSRNKTPTVCPKDIADRGDGPPQGAAARQGTSSPRSGFNAQAAHRGPTGKAPPGTPGTANRPARSSTPPVRSDAPSGSPSGPGRDRMENAVAAPPPPDTLTLHRMILDRLGMAPLAEDQLIRDLAVPAAKVAPALLFLELDGRIQRQPGGMLARR